MMLRKQNAWPYIKHIVVVSARINTEFSERNDKTITIWDTPENPEKTLIKFLKCGTVVANELSFTEESS